MRRYKSTRTIRRMTPNWAYPNNSTTTSEVSTSTFTTRSLTALTVGGTSIEDNSTEDEIGLEDIDFCLELLHSDIINVAYILELIAELNPFSENYEEQRRHIIDTMIKDAELRSKSQLIDGFIRQNVDEDKGGLRGAQEESGWFC